MPELSTRDVVRFGWIPDQPDQRDYAFAAPVAILVALPASVDLRTQLPPPYDQGSLASSTASAIAAAIQFEQQRQGVQVLMPSRLFIYYNERVMMGTEGVDSGAQIRDGLKAVARHGFAPEAEWPYDIHYYARRPPDAMYQDARGTIAYERVAQNLVQLKGCLASARPFLIGFSVYESFLGPEARGTGRVSVPGAAERVVGGHAALAVGYSDAEQAFLLRNSWGGTWGDNGHFWLPYLYAIQPNLARDFWTVQVIAR